MSYQSALCIDLGFADFAPNGGVNAWAMNNSTNWIAYAFVAQAATTLNDFRFYNGTGLQGTGGTIGCSLYADSSGVPNTGGAALDTLTAGAIAGNSWVECTGGTFVLTAGTKYWVVLKNNDGTPGTNFFEPAFFSAQAGFPYSNGAAFTSSNSGTSWTKFTGGAPCRFGFADGNYLGMPVSAISFPTGANALQGGHVIGTRLTLPANVKFNVAGMACFWKTGGTPTGNLLYSIYDASHNLLASCYTVPNGEAVGDLQLWTPRLINPSTNGGSGVLTLTGGSTYTIAMSNTATDSSSNYFVPYYLQWDSDANSTPLIPWSMTYDFYNGSVWAQTTAQFMPFKMLLATGNEFAASGGGGVRVNPGVTGGYTG